MSLECTATRRHKQIPPKCRLISTVAHNAETPIDFSFCPSFPEFTTMAAEKSDNECQICGDDSDGLHFGSYSCRACAAFFRRTVTMNLEYNCRGNGACGVSKAARNSCRSCRLTRCLNVGMQASAVQLARDGIGNAKKRDPDALPQMPPPPKTQKVEVQLPPASPLQFPVSYFPAQPIMLTRPLNIFPETQVSMFLIPKMQQGYQYLLSARRAAHVRSGKSDFSGLFKKETELKPSKFDVCKEICMQEVHVASDMVKTYFIPFGDVPEVDQTLLFKNFFCYLSHTDRAYQSYKMFGHDEANCRLLMPDGGYITTNDLQSFYRGANGVHKSPEEAAKVFRPAMDFMLNVIISHMKEMGILEMEYVVLLALFLWNDACEGISKETLCTIRKTHDIFFSDLHLLYRQIGLEESQITRRTAQLMLLLPKLAKCVVMLRENSELAELFEIYDADVCCQNAKNSV